MFNDKEAHFEGDYFFKEQAFGTTTAAQTSGVFRLGNTEGGIRIRGFVDGNGTSASGATITTVVQVADEENSTAWTNLESKTFTAQGTALTGDFFGFIPDTDKRFVRCTVANGTAISGKFNLALEYVPR